MFLYRGRKLIEYLDEAHSGIKHLMKLASCYTSEMQT